MLGTQAQNTDTFFQGDSVNRLESAGFRFGDRGTHTSRTIMLSELSALLDSVPRDASRGDYAEAVTEDNCLGKQTTATRKLSLQRLRELYGLDPELPLFRALRTLWSRDTASRPLLAILGALARDPLLRDSAPTILNTPIGRELSRQELTTDMAGRLGERFNEAVLDKIIRNVSSSWTQSGHLQGRVRKIRTKVTPTPTACTFALYLGYQTGKRGRLLFETPFAATLDTRPHELVNLAAEAKRLGFLNLKQSGSTIDVSFPGLIDRAESEGAHGTH